MQLTQRKIHTHTFLLITFLIFNWFSIWLKFWKAETQGFPTMILNAMYVEACLRCGKKLKIRGVMLCILMLKVSKEAQNGLILSFFSHLWHTYHYSPYSVFWASFDTFNLDSITALTVQFFTVYFELLLIPLTWEYMTLWTVRMKPLCPFMYTQIRWHNQITLWILIQSI